MRTRAVFTVFAGLTVLAVATVQDGVLLRKELKEGASETYAVTITGNQNIEVPTQGPMEMGFKGGYQWIFDYKKVDAAKNSAEIDITVKDLKFEVQGPMADMMPGGDTVPKEVKSTATLDGRYRMTNSKAAGGNMAMMMMMGAGASMSPFIELPEKAVKPGDAWPVVLPKNPMMGDVEVKLEAKFVGEGKDGERSGNQIEMTGTIPLNMDIGKLMEEMAKSGNDPSGGAMAGMKMVMKGTMKMNVVAILDKTTGKALTATMTIASDTNMELVDMGMSIPTKGTTTMKFVLK